MLLILKDGDALAITLSSGADVAVHVSYVDKDGDTITADRVNTVLTSAGTFDLLAGPTGDVERNIQFVSVQNKDGSVAQTFTLLHDDQTNAIGLRKRTIDAGDIDNWAPMTEGAKGDVGDQGPEGDASPAGWDVVVCQKETSGTAGGGLTSGAWRTRVLNTELQDRLGITLSSNQFSLGIGEYEAEWSVPGYYCGGHQSRLWNVTNSVAHYGSPEYSPASQPDATQSRSVGYAKFTIGGLPGSFHTFELQQRGFTTAPTNGMGVPNSFGDEVYSILKIRKIG